MSQSLDLVELDRQRFSPSSRQRQAVMLIEAYEFTPEAAELLGLDLTGNHHSLDCRLRTHWGEADE
jgi:hypothetical protein